MITTLNEFKKLNESINENNFNEDSSIEQILLENPELLDSNISDVIDSYNTLEILGFDEDGLQLLNGEGDFDFIEWQDVMDNEPNIYHEILNWLEQELVDLDKAMDRSSDYGTYGETYESNVITSIDEFKKYLNENFTPHEYEKCTVTIKFNRALDMDEMEEIGEEISDFDYEFNNEGTELIIHDTTDPDMDSVYNVLDDLVGDENFTSDHNYDDTEEDVYESKEIDFKKLGYDSKKEFNDRVKELAKEMNKDTKMPLAACKKEVLNTFRDASK